MATVVEAIRKIPGPKHLVMEEGLQSAWFCETLSPHAGALVDSGVTESRGYKPISAMRAEIAVQRLKYTVHRADLTV